MRIAPFFRALAGNLLVTGIVLLAYAAIVVTCVLAFTRPRPTTLVDVVFVFDTTASMQPHIDGLLRRARDFAGILEQAGANYRFAMVTFGARGEVSPVIRETFPFSGDVSAFKAFVSGLHDHGGGPEDQLAGMQYALANFSFRPGTHKMLIFVSDEPLFGTESHGSSAAPRGEWRTMVTRVAGAGITAYAVAIDDESFQDLAARTGGRFYDINGNSDFTDILLDIAQNINANLTR